MSRLSVLKTKRKVKICVEICFKRCKEAWYCFLLPFAIVAILVFLIIPQECILKDYIPSHLIILDVVTRIGSSESNPRLLPCPLNPPQIKFDKPVQTKRNVINKEFLKEFNVEIGGKWQPTKCKPRFKTAIIVPYRARQEQLEYFLLYMHSFLTKQQIAYTIFVVQQYADKPFNRGKLFNVGFAEISKREDFDCFIFHDVDLLPEILSNIYGCSSQPRHLITALDTFNYKLPYCELMGGAVALTPTQFIKVNGFANRFFGWGGEDDDFYKRVTLNDFRVVRWDPKVARYFMMVHNKEKPNDLRHSLLKNASVMLKDDGLNNLEYSVIDYVKNFAYTWIYVEV